MPRPSFSVEPATGPAGPCLRVRGDLDLATAPEVREAIVRFAEPDSLVIIDMAGVAFIDSTGIGALVGAQNELRATGGGITLHGVGAHVRRVFEITGVMEVLRVDQAAPVAS